MHFLRDDWKIVAGQLSYETKKIHLVYYCNYHLFIRLFLKEPIENDSLRVIHW